MLYSSAGNDDTIGEFNVDEKGDLLCLCAWSIADSCSYARGRSCAASSGLSTRQEQVLCPIYQAYRKVSK